MNRVEDVKINYFVVSESNVVISESKVFQKRILATYLKHQLLSENYVQRELNKTSRSSVAQMTS